MPADGWLEPLLGHFDDPLVAAVAPRDRAATGAAERARPLRGGAFVARPGRRRRAGAAGEPRSPSCRARPCWSAADVATGPELFDAVLRGGEDVDLVWRLAEAGWDVRYVPASTVDARGPGDARVVPGAPGLLRDDGGAAGPAPPRRAGPGARVRLVAGGLGLRWPAGPCSRWPRWRRPSAILADRLSGLVRDPVAVATRIAGGGTARAAAAGARRR